MIKLNTTQLVTGVVAAIAAWFIINKVIPKVSVSEVAPGENPLEDETP